MGEETDQFRTAVEARLQAEFGCAERDAERIAATAAHVRESPNGPDWSPSFVVEKLTDAPKAYSLPEKWNWLLMYLGETGTDLDEFRIEA